MAEETVRGKKARNQPSRIRKIYIARLVIRCLLFAGSGLVLYFDPAQAEILQGWNFFRRFSPFHILWAAWVIDMLWQLIPAKNHLTKGVALGSQKLFRFRFQPIREAFSYHALQRHIIQTTKAAYKVFVIWTALTVGLLLMRYLEWIDDTVLLLISIAFYVCDLICVLIWCPFRLILRNRCCTTCRIFNWDHLMMFTPMLSVNGFFSRSLLLMSVGVWLCWELCVMMYPERFWEHSNEALRCTNCTDKLCTQYCGCRKLDADNNPNI